MENKGWIKTYRSIFDWEWWAEPLMVKAFLYFLIKAAIKDGVWRNVPYKRGQIVTTLRKIAADLDVSYRQARTILFKLKMTHNIDTKAYRNFSIITICNYDSYQSDIVDVRITKSQGFDTQNGTGLTTEVSDLRQEKSQGSDTQNGSRLTDFPSQKRHGKRHANGTENDTEIGSLSDYESETYEEEYDFSGTQNGTQDGTISAQGEARNVAPIIRIKEYNNISRSSNIVQVQNLADWLKNSGQMWKEATAMNLGLKSLAELEPLFDVYQRECIAQGLDSQVEEKIKSHFVNLIRRKNNGKNKQQDAKSCATSSREQRMRDLKNFVDQNMGGEN